MDNVNTIETQTIPREWNSSLWHEYLLSLSRGENAVLPNEQYPDSIELNTEWHTILNQLRAETQNDMIERYVPVGYKDDRRTLYVPRSYPTGNPDCIPVWLAMHMNWIAKQEGIEGLSGSIHSHPRKFTDIQRRFWKPSPQVGVFSAQDFYALLSSDDNQGQFSGVVDGTDNLIMFKSKETHDLLDKFTHNETTFADYWFKKYGLTPVQNGLIYQPKAAPLDTQIQMNNDIASTYKLAYYHGTENEKLKRIC